MLSYLVSQPVTALILFYAAVCKAVKFCRSVERVAVYGAVARPNTYFLSDVISTASAFLPAADQKRALSLLLY